MHYEWILYLRCNCAFSSLKFKHLGGLTPSWNSFQGKFLERLNIAATRRLYLVVQKPKTRHVQHTHTKNFLGGGTPWPGKPLSKIHFLHVVHADLFYHDILCTLRTSLLPSDVRKPQFGEIVLYKTDIHDLKSFFLLYETSFELECDEKFRNYWELT